MLMLSGIIVIALLFSLVFYLILIYNNLVSLKNNVAKNWANIDVLLKQRYAELPKLIDACQAYMTYEQETLTKVVEARKSALFATESKDLVALGAAELSLQSGLSKLFALSENYPDLKTNASFQQLQSRISELENTIADRRELYNNSVNINNIRIEQIPDIFIARAFHFIAFDLLKISTEESQDVSIKKQFNA
jgi:LemA protein